MAELDPALSHIERLRRWRSIRDRDVDLSFMQRQFDEKVSRPFCQLQSIIPLWQQLVPPLLLDHTRLESLSRGTLRVAVDTSSHLYALDRLLRGGLQQQLMTDRSTKGLRRIQLRVQS